MNCHATNTGLQKAFPSFSQYWIQESIIQN